MKSTKFIFWTCTILIVLFEGLLQATGRASANLTPVPGLSM